MEVVAFKLELELEFQLEVVMRRKAGLSGL